MRQKLWCIDHSPQMSQGANNDGVNLLVVNATTLDMAWIDFDFIVSIKNHVEHPNPMMKKLQEQQK
jgi:hypothetical protein